MHCVLSSLEYQYWWTTIIVIQTEVFDFETEKAVIQWKPWLDF